jgi:hypothetical protein
MRGRFVSPASSTRMSTCWAAVESLEELRLDDASDFATLQARVRAWADPEARWVTGEGWSYGAFPNGMPTRLQLDALVPDRPALLGSYDGHTGYNSAALRLAEITRARRIPRGRDRATPRPGRPQGVGATAAEAAAAPGTSAAATPSRVLRELGPDAPGGDLARSRACRAATGLAAAARPALRRARSRPAARAAAGAAPAYSGRACGSGR